MAPLYEHAHYMAYHTHPIVECAVQNHDYVTHDNTKLACHGPVRYGVDLYLN